MDRWTASDWSLDLVQGDTASPIRTASYIPYSGRTPPEGVTGQLVYDLTYGPGDSALIREAREAGCAAIDGLPMLIAQAELQFEWWTGQRPDARVMRAAATDELYRMERP